MNKEPKVQGGYVEVAVPKGTGGQLRALAAAWELSVDQTQERVIRSGIDAYWSGRRRVTECNTGVSRSNKSICIRSKKR